MNKNVALALLVLGGLVLLVNTASAITPKPRPQPIITPVPPSDQPIVSAR